MGQYFMLSNITRNEEKSVGTFYADWEPYVEQYSWSMEDHIIAYGDRGDVYRLNDPNSVPDRFQQVLSYNEWSIILFSAELLKMKPEELADKYLVGC
tara:strand:+ start:178 stop:468 length:291 start_codon:yes stop_codon:yes gene_type:complete